MTPTTLARRALILAAGLALVALPAAAALSTSGTAGSADGALVAGGTVEAAPAPGATSQATALGTGVGGATTTATTGISAATPGSAQDTSGASVAAAVPSDEAGSTEARKVSRSCGAPADSHYVPSSGRDANQCYDADGNFRSTRTYTATHYTNDVDCGDKNVQGGVGAVGLWIAGTADAGGGFVSVCSDDQVPIQGRATVRGNTGTPGGSATVDGDKDNPEETTQGWATISAAPAGPSYRCGKSYADGGRADSDAPTSEDTADECG